MKTIIKTIIPTSVLQEVMDAMDDMACDSRLLDMTRSRVHQFDAARDALRAAMEQPDAIITTSVPAGWNLVPVELTQDMLDQLRFGWADISTAHLIDRWNRTVDAAPQPPELENPPSLFPLPADLHDSKDWRCGTYSERVEWLHTMYESAKEQIAALERVQGEQGWSVRVAQQPPTDMPDALASQVVNALTSYCNTGKIDGADDLLDSLLYSIVHMHKQETPTDGQINAALFAWFDTERGEKSFIDRMRSAIDATLPLKFRNLQPNPAPYLWYDPENGDTWTQEAVDEGFCVTDGLIPLYTK